MWQNSTKIQFSQKDALTLKSRSLKVLCPSKIHYISKIWEGIFPFDIYVARVQCDILYVLCPFLSAIANFTIDDFFLNCVFIFLKMRNLIKTYKMVQKWMVPKMNVKLECFITPSVVQAINMHNLLIFSMLLNNFEIS